jgi:carboxypeptidase C (cathepsin A)
MRSLKPFCPNSLSHLREAVLFYAIILNMEKSRKALGVDIGNVIINNRFNYLNTLDESGYAALPEVDSAFDSLKTLNQYFSGEVYLISKCTPWAEEQILKWLEKHNFYSKTGVNKQHVHFVREKQEKDVICKKLGITHFIDDRLEVLSHMINSTPNLFLFQPDETEVTAFSQFLPHIQRVESWDEILQKIKFMR